VFLVPELPKEDKRLLEVLNCCSDATGMNESETEVVERQRLGAPVTELTHDRKCATMVLGRRSAIAFTSKLRSERIESKRFAVPVDCGWFRLTNLQGCTDLMRSDICEAVQVLLKAEVIEPRRQLSRSSLDRQEGCPQRLSHSVAAQEPESSRQDTSDEQEGEGSKQDDSEPESRQHSGQQEPDSGECEYAMAQLLPVD
jgi:hypothetical protein